MQTECQMAMCSEGSLAGHTIQAWDAQLTP